MQTLSYRYPLKKVILLHALYRYTTTPIMVIVVTAMDTHGSWQINFASLVLGISKVDIVSEIGSLWRVIAVTKVLSFLCLKESYIWGAVPYTQQHNWWSSTPHGLWLKLEMSLL